MIIGGQLVQFAFESGVRSGHVTLIGERSKRGSLVALEFGDRCSAVRWEDELIEPKWTGQCPLHKDFMAKAAREHLRTADTQAKR